VAAKEVWIMRLCDVAYLICKKVPAGNWWMLLDLPEVSFLLPKKCDLSKLDF
jgi:hypothetical protein